MGMFFFFFCLVLKYCNTGYNLTLDMNLLCGRGTKYAANIKMFEISIITSVHREPFSKQLQVLISSRFNPSVDIKVDIYPRRIPITHDLYT